MELNIIRTIAGRWVNVYARTDPKKGPEQGVERIPAKAPVKNAPE
jgi:hypothetical protein